MSRPVDFVSEKFKLSAGKITRRSTQEKCRANNKATVNPACVGFDVEPVTEYYVRCEVQECDFQIMNYCTCTEGRCYMAANNHSFKDMETRLIVRR